MTFNKSDEKISSPLASAQPCCPTQLKHLHGTDHQLVPSPYNARTKAPDGRLVLWNSKTGAISVFSAAQCAIVEAMLSKSGIPANFHIELSDYLRSRGFLVHASSDQYSTFQYSFGKQHYRSDVMELILMASEDCNFRCTYCYEEFQRGTMAVSIRNGLKHLLSQRAKKLSQLGVAWFGGEPLYGFAAIEDLAPHLMKVAQEHSIEYTASITTNGYLLSHEVASKLLAWNISKFQVTLDGLPEHHDCSRPARDGSPTFNVILSNLLSLQARANENYHVRIRVNFDPSSCSSIEPFLDLLQKHFAGDSRFVIAFHRVSQWGGINDRDMGVCGIGEAHNLQAQFETSAARRGLRIETLADRNEMGSSACIASRPYNLIIGADGRIMKCSISLDKDPGNIVGVLHEDGTIQLNESRLAQWTAPAFEHDPSCHKCHLLPSCQGLSCPLVRNQTNASPCKTTAKHNLHNELMTVLADPKRTQRTVRLLS